MNDRDLKKTLQMALNELGFDAGTVDGVWGRRTRGAAADYLADRAYEGLAEVLPPVQFKGAGKRLDDIDLPRIGATFGVGEDEIHAIIDVESRGSGFDRQGRVLALFEPHVFWRELGPGPERDRAAAAGLAYPNWTAGGYPSDSYPRIIAACEINEDAALRSTSWGMFQIMGFNCLLAGYGSARAMIEAFKDDEEAHLEAMATFVVSSGLDAKLRRHDWRGFARGYNGSGYARHGYHTKLEVAYRKWSKIADTPYDPQT